MARLLKLPNSITKPGGSHDALTILLVAGISLLALALRVPRLDLQPLWWDEGYSVFFATRDFVDMLARTAVDIHPPLYYVMLQLWIMLAGKSDVALRMLSVVIGVATIPFMYLFGRLLFNRRIGIVSALVLAVSPFSVYYSQEVRMYGLVTLLALISMVLQFSLLARARASTQAGLTDHGQLRMGMVIWFLYILSTAAALYAEYYAAIALAAEIAVVLYWWRRRGTRLGHWLLAWTAVLILYLPWIIYAGPKLYTYVTAKVGIELYSRLDPITFLVQHLTAFSLGHLIGSPLLGWGTVFFVALAGYGVFRTYRHPIQPGLLSRKDATRAAAPSVETASMYFLAPLFGGWLVNLLYSFHPIRYERLLLFAAPPFYVLVAAGLVALFERRERLAYVAAFVLIALTAGSLTNFYTVPRYPDEDYRPLIHQMALESRTGDVVLAPYPWQIGYLESYFPDPRLQTVEVPSDKWISEPGSMEAALNSIHSTSLRTWLLAYQTKGRLLEDQIANYFADDYRLADDWYGNTRLEYFEKAADPPLIEKTMVFAPDLKLDSYGVQPGPVVAGNGFLLLRLHWDAGSNAYSYSLRLVDGSGEKRVQEDKPVDLGNEIERLGVFIPRGTPAGDYELKMVVYLRTDASPLPLPDGSHEFTLARVPVNAP